ncbi:MAG TPA: tRNA (adenosine(37)-N6)-threonylcarbamoyltransferase complex dimerization subunit type 1 TsaB [Vicinamibacterales bacterium]|nr:tRNA (adenosine(37)-N6)-threonylcarbamoyltransferase complex dimerization subunit type 1 TsaB [Vicinamibacterales bacterium]
MRILALDTTTRGGSAALVDDGVVIGERAGDAARAQAERLPGELKTLLDAARVPLSAVDVYAVAAGPGSFTGVRVGIATMQGLAFAEGKPLVGVSALDALHLVGREAAGAERIATWIDAWRGEVYAALYEHGEEIESASVERPEQILARLGTRPTLFIGDGAGTYAAQIRERHPDAALADPAHPLLAATIARLAATAVRAGHRPPPHAIRALYVRRPDAELARDARVDR